MSYKIVLDSCGELPAELLGDHRFERVPLGLEVGEYKILDDENFDQAEFLRKVAESPKCPKSSCPSPERFMESYGEPEAEHVYAVTLSSPLSGSYNSAELGKKLYHEKYGDKKIHVVDSRSASGGETQIALKLVDLEEAGLPFEEIVERIEEFRDNLQTYFVLDNLETLRKNGRLTGVKALVASTLSIKPVMGADKGEIIQRSQTIGIKKALSRMAELVAKEVKGPEEKRLVITHCNAPDRAEQVKKMILEKVRFRECIIMDMRGVSTMYANDGGVIVTA
ncbi:DegV family protein [bacterium D16-50]|nr:DegV family protein [bacterium D16-50]